MKGFPKGDPRAVSAGRKGGKALRAMRTLERTPDYERGYQAGWKARDRRIVAETIRTEQEEG